MKKAHIHIRLGLLFFIITLNDAWLFFLVSYILALKILISKSMNTLLLVDISIKEEARNGGFTEFCKKIT